MFLCCFPECTYIILDKELLAQDETSEVGKEDRHKLIYNPASVPVQLIYIGTCAAA